MKLIVFYNKKFAADKLIKNKIKIICSNFVSWLNDFGTKVEVSFDLNISFQVKQK